MEINNQIYSINEEKKLPDVGGMGYFLTHKKSGAKIVLIENQDDNKVFSAAFRTPAKDDKGTAHIIEHSVLSGSEKYPMKDAYLELLKGSLHTFLNAMTYSDKTVYPVASCNDKDFKNLMDVYLNAVFCPQIKEKKEIFMQEGIRYVYDEENDELTIQGIVYNEMKGAFASPTKRLMQQISKSLYPDTSYKYCSGGNPEAIGNLSYEEFLDFYDTYYHPSNCCLYLYGDMDFEERLDYLDKEYLSKYEKKDVDSSLKLQPSYHKMKGTTGKYPAESDDDAQTYFAYSIALPACHDALTYMSMRVIDYILFSSNGAILYQAFTDSGIGESCWGEFHFAQKQPSYSIICMNARTEEEERFLGLITDTLKEIVKNGIDKDMLNAAIHHLEFVYREANFGSDPKGLVYAEDIYKKIIYDEDDIFELLCMNGIFDELRKKAEGRYFENLIEKWFINSDHCALDVLLPDKSLQESEDSQLKEELAEKLKSMDKKVLIGENEKFRRYQDEEEPAEVLEKLPVLERADLIEEKEEFKNEEMKLGGIKTVFHELPTNGIGYLNVCFDMSKIPNDLLPYAAFMSDIIGQMNTYKHTYRQLDTIVSRNCGGIWNKINTYDKIPKNGPVYTLFVEGSKMMYSEIPFVIDAVEERLLQTDFSDEKRMKELLQQNRADLRQYLKRIANSVAVTEAKSNFSLASQIISSISGLRYLRFLDKMYENYCHKEIVNKLEQVKRLVFTKENVIVSYTGERSSIKLLSNNLDRLYKMLFDDLGEKYTQELDKANADKLALTTASSVQYVALCGQLDEEASKYKGVWNVTSHILYCDYLWQNVRAKGGAYGCSAGFNSGTCAVFSSYRDPNLKETMDVYEQIPEYLEKFNVDERQMVKYIVGTYNEYVQSESEKEKGERYFSYYMCGETEEEKQEEKEQVINTTTKDIRRVSKYIKQMLKRSYTVVVAGEERIEKDRDLFDEIKSL